MCVCAAAAAPAQMFGQKSAAALRAMLHPIVAAQKCRKRESELARAKNMYIRQHIRASAVDGRRLVLSFDSFPLPPLASEQVNITRTKKGACKKWTCKLPLRLLCHKSRVATTQVQLMSQVSFLCTLHDDASSCGSFVRKRRTSSCRYLLPA